MPFPATREALEAAGYHYDTRGRCRGHRCQAEIDWWFTPQGHRIPLNPDCTPHWASCHDKAQFRKKGR